MPPTGLPRLVCAPMGVIGGPEALIQALRPALGDVLSAAAAQSADLRGEASALAVRFTLGERPR